MRYQNGLQALLIKLQPLAPQILPFFVFPILTILALRIARFAMFGAFFSWSSPRDTSNSHDSRDGKRLKKKGAGVRTEQLASHNGEARPSKSFLFTNTLSNRTAQTDTRAVDDGYYPGLVNMSGTYCFMNSVVQVSLGSTMRWLPFVHCLGHRRSLHYHT